MNDVKVEIQRSSWNTSYYVTGDDTAVQQWCGSLLLNYHPAGYGTFFRLHKRNPDGTVTYLASRANSCD